MKLIALFKVSKKPLIKGLLLSSAFVSVFTPLFVGFNQAEASVGFGAISHDSAAASGATTNFNWTHTPGHTPRGVLVYVVQDTSAADQVSSVTYGSATLNRVAVACDTVTEPGCTYVYFAGSDLPSGAQTVTVNVSGGAGKHASAITYSASRDTEINNFSVINANAANPSIALGLNGKSSHVSLGFFSGHSAVSSITPSTSWTSQYEDDYTSAVAGFYTYDNVGTTTVTTGFTQTAEDVAMVAVAVSEVEMVSEKTIFVSPGNTEFVVPSGVTDITVKAWGAGGGGGGGATSFTAGGAGGAGGFAQGTIPVTAGETLDLTIGVGGTGGEYGTLNDTGGGGAGGGRTEVTRSGASLLIAAGGGGGGGGDDAATTAGGAGGAGGNTISGGNGVDSSSSGSEANGATGSAGGTGGTGTFNSGANGASKAAGDGADGSGTGTTDGSSNNSNSIDDGDGGNTAATNPGGGGGGGGYYGGGGGGSDTGSGGDGGGGGVAYFAATTYATTSTAGSGTTPGNTADGDFDADNAGGGAAGAAGSFGAHGEHGLIVISYVINPITINGTLYENDGVTPITSGATVALIATSTETAYSTTTDASGNFSLATASFSEGGESWTVRTTDPDAGWFDVAYASSTFVAIAGCGMAPELDCVMYSTDNGATWATTTAAGEDDFWWALTYGNDTFVAVAACSFIPDSDCIMTSPDGITWTPRSTPGNNATWKDITYGDGTFVAVASEGDSHAMYSLDNGVTWATTTIAGDNDVWNKVTYGNGTFVALATYDSGDPHLVATSPDGITWTPRSVAGNDDYWVDVVFANGTFVAIGNCEGGEDCHMTSVDGINWTVHDTDHDNWLKALAYGSNTFVALADHEDDFSVMTSPDGITWTVQSAAGNDDVWSSVTYGNGTFVAVGYGSGLGGVGDDIVMTASAGFNERTPLTLYIDDEPDVKATALFYIDVATTTQNGIDLQSETVRIEHASSSGIVDLSSSDFYDYTADSDIHFTIDGATTTIGSASISADLLVASSTVLSAPTTLRLYGDFTNNGTLDFASSTLYIEGLDPTLSGSFVGVNALDDVVVDHRTGAGNWTTRLQESWSAVAFGEGKFAAVGSYEEWQAMTSADGVTWATSSAPGSGDGWRDMTYGDGTFVAVGRGYNPGEWAMYSDDGVTWASTTAAEDNDSWNDVTYGDGLFVAVGHCYDDGGGEGNNDDCIMTSPDGETWTAQSVAGNDDNWHGVAYGAGLFVAVGPCSYYDQDLEAWSPGGDCIMSSSDGVTWATTTVAGSASSSWNGITYNDGLFVVTGACDGLEENCHNVMTSPDGLTWTPDVAINSEVNLGDIEYGNGLFVALGSEYNYETFEYDPLALTSPDGFVWTQKNFPFSFQNKIAYGNGTFVSVYSSVVGAEPLLMLTTASTSDLTINTNKKLSTTNPLTVSGNLLNDGVLVSTSTLTAAGNISGDGTLDNSGTLYLTGNNKTVTVTQPEMGNVTVTGNIDFLSNASTTNLTIASSGTLEPHNALTIGGIDPYWGTPTGGSFTQNGSVDLSGTDVYVTSVGTISGNLTGANAFSNLTIDPGSHTPFAIRSVAGTDDMWYDIIYAEDKYVAVGRCGGDASCVMYSTDGGTTWATSTPAGNDDEWFAVTYGEGTFVAIGSCEWYDDCVMSSPDGINWTPHSAAGNDDRWVDVAYGNGTFVAIKDCGFGGTDCVMTSPDGETWTAQSSVLGDDDPWKSLTYADGLFVAVGGGVWPYADNLIMTSPDGETWTGQTSPSEEDDWRDVTYGEGLFVAVGSQSNVVMTSPDGETWTPRSAFGNDDSWLTVTYGNGLFVAMGGTCFYGGDCLMVSTDGITWSLLEHPGPELQGAVYAEELILVGYDYSGADIATFSWATTTATSPIETDALSITLNSNFRSLGGDVTVNDNYLNNGIHDNTSTTTVAGNFLNTGEFNNTGVLYMTGNNKTIDSSSVDIGNLTIGGSTDLLMNATTSNLRVNSGGTLDPHDVLTVEGNFINSGSLNFANSTVYLEGAEAVVSGSFAGANALSNVVVNPSTGGSNWSAYTAAGNDDDWNSVTYGDGLFVAVSSNGNRVMTSPDGETWTAQSAAGNDDYWYGVTYGEGLFVAVGIISDRVMTSPDGINWTARSAAGDDDSWSSVTYGGGMFVAVGTDRVMTSPDGINWDQRSAAGDGSWNSVVYGDGLFVAVSSNEDLVMTSPDGINWTARSAAGNNDEWYGVTYGKGLFVAVGANGSDRVMTSPDGINWTARSAAGNNDQWRSVVYSSGLFVAVGSNGDRVMTSPDGINWTARSAAGNNDGWYGVTYGEGKFVAVSLLGSDRAMMTEGAFMTLPSLSSMDMTITASTTLTSTATLTVNGDYTNNGTFNASTSEIMLDGSVQQNVAGNITGTSAFNDLTISNTSEDGVTDQSVIFGGAVETLGTFTMESGTSAQFPAGSTSTIQNIDLQGIDGNKVYLRSSSDDDYWYLDVPGSQFNVDYVDVKDSYASTTMSAVNSTDSGHNVNWVFGAPTFSGSTTISAHDAGQVSNAFTSQNKTNEELLAFKLTPNTSTATVTNMVIGLNGAKRIATSSFSSIRLLRDNDNDGEYDAGDTAVGGAGVMTLSGQSGTITFTDDFLLSTAQNFIVVANWTAPSNGAFLQVSISPSGITASNEEGDHEILGSMIGIQHGRNNRGGGGGASFQIGGEPPASPDVGGGDSGGGDDPGEQIGGDPNYKRPSWDSGSWSNPERAYNQTNNTYSTDNAGTSHDFGNANLGTANGVTIDGVEIRMEVSGTTAAGTIGVQLSWDGGTSWTSAKSTPTLTTSDVVVTLGGPSDTWGRGWSVDQLTNGNFRMRVTGAPSSNTVRIDEIQVRVYSSVSGGGGGGGGDI